MDRMYLLQLAHDFIRVEGRIAPANPLHHGKQLLPRGAPLFSFSGDTRKPVVTDSITAG
jgi:hypothetical protein